MQIASKEECRKQIVLYRFLEDTLHEMQTDNPEKLKAWIDDTKRDVRSFLNRPSRWDDRRVVRDDGIDGWVERVECPASIQNDQDAEEWFESEEMIEYRWSPYDCTGQLFTGWHRVFKVNGKYICYHRIDRDV